MVVVGADHVGKSTLLRALAGRAHRIVSCDDDLVAPAYQVLTQLRDGLGRTMATGQAYSREFLLSGFQLALVYLRDELVKWRRHERVLVDSYYYKVLSKCRLHGLDVPRITELWREFPAPDLVLSLGADDDVLWERTARGHNLNPLEYYGREPDRAAYLAFQRDLVREMNHAIQGVPVCELDGNRELADLVRQAEAAIAIAQVSPRPSERALAAATVGSR